MGRVPVHVGVLHFFTAPWVGKAVPRSHVLPTEVVVLFAIAISTSGTMTLFMLFTPALTGVLLVI